MLTFPSPARARTACWYDALPSSPTPLSRSISGGGGGGEGGPNFAASPTKEDPKTSIAPSVRVGEASARYRVMATTLVRKSTLPSASQ